MCHHDLINTHITGWYCHVPSWPHYHTYQRLILTCDIMTSLPQISQTNTDMCHHDLITTHITGWYWHVPSWPHYHRYHRLTLTCAIMTSLPHISQTDTDMCHHDLITSAFTEVGSRPCDYWYFTIPARFDLQVLLIICRFTCNFTTMIAFTNVRGYL